MLKASARAGQSETGIPLNPEWVLSRVCGLTASALALCGPCFCALFSMCGLHVGFILSILHLQKHIGVGGSDPTGQKFWQGPLGMCYEIELYEV